MVTSAGTEHTHTAWLASLAMGEAGWTRRLDRRRGVGGPGCLLCTSTRPSVELERKYGGHRVGRKGRGPPGREADCAWPGGDGSG